MSCPGGEEGEGEGGYTGATLVICPLVAVIQWRQEIARYTVPGALKVRLRLAADRQPAK